MNKGNSKNLDEILNSIKQEEIEIEILKGDLRSKSKGKIKRLFLPNDYRKQQFKLYRKETRDQIKSKKEFVYNEQGYLYRLCTLNFDIATRFIASTLSIIENEQYEAVKVELSDIFARMSPFNLGVQMAHTTITCLITTSENIREVLKIYKRDKDDIKRITQNYIMLKPSYKYSLYDCMTQSVPEQLTRNYPYLVTIVRDLINLRLANPNLTEEQATNAMLQQISERYPELIRNSKDK